MDDSNVYGSVLVGNKRAKKASIVAGVFYRLGIIEKFGTGIARVNIAYNLLKRETKLSRKELDETLGLDKSKTIRIINNLMNKNLIQKQGQGPATTYKLSCAFDK